MDIFFKKLIVKHNFIMELLDIRLFLIRKGNVGWDNISTPLKQ